MGAITSVETLLSPERLRANWKQGGEKKEDTRKEAGGMPVEDDSLSGDLATLKRQLEERFDAAAMEVFAFHLEALEAAIHRESPDAEIVERLLTEMEDLVEALGL